MKISYNSSRPDIILPEYGRSIHEMVKHCASIADREERNRCARAIITTMGNLFPYLRDTDDFKHKLWDHLHIMSDFTLQVDAPYPPPSRETLSEKPRRLTYPSSKIKYGHYGITIEKIVDEVAAEPDPEKRKQMAIGVANLMKRTYVVWNQNAVKDETIASDLSKLSNGKLTIDNPEEALAPTREVMQQMGVNQQQNKNQGSGRSRKRQGRKGSRKKRN